MGNIRLSDKHGVNPAIPKCFFCGEHKNEIIIFGKLKGDAEAPRDFVLDHAPCDTCKDYMDKGVILISVRDGEEGDNPYRTGGWVVVTDEAIPRFVTNEAICEETLKKRIAFVPDEAWDMLGLPARREVPPCR